MLESKTTANVSPNLSFDLENNCTLKFNFQPDSRVVVIGYQDGRAITGALNLEQVSELRDVLTAYLEKRG